MGLGQNNEQLFINAAKVAVTGENEADLKVTDIRNLLSKKKARNANTHVIFRVYAHHRIDEMTIVNCGANGGISGEDMRIVSYYCHRR